MLLLTSAGRAMRKVWDAVSRTGGRPMSEEVRVRIAPPWPAGAPENNRKRWAAADAADLLRETPESIMERRRQRGLKTADGKETPFSVVRRVMEGPAMAPVGSGKKEGTSNIERQTSNIERGDGPVPPPPDALLVGRVLKPAYVGQEAVTPEPRMRTEDLPADYMEMPKETLIRC